MRSFTRKEKAMSLPMHFQENMNMKGPFFPFLHCTRLAPSCSLGMTTRSKKIAYDPTIVGQFSSFPGYSWHNDVIFYKGHLYLSKQSQLKSTVLSELHAIPTVGHSGFTKTYDQVKRSFFWNGMK
jgi:hypothetical protein